MTYNNNNNKQCEIITMSLCLIRHSISGDDK